MVVKTEGIHTLEFLISEANGWRSREQGVVTVAGAVALPSGQLLGQITATSKYVAYNDAASNGSETVAAILIDACPNVNGDYKCGIIVRDAEVLSSALTGKNANGLADLAALGIIVRS